MVLGHYDVVVGLCGSLQVVLGGCGLLWVAWAVCKPRNHEITKRNSEIAKRHTFSQNIYLKYKVVVYMNKSRPM